MSLPNLTAQQSLGPALGNYLALASPTMNSEENIETMMDLKLPSFHEVLKSSGVFLLNDYLERELANDVLKQIFLYQERGYQFPTSFPIGQERTVQGWIYGLLFERFDVSKGNEYFCLLEYPYPGETGETDEQRTDITLVNSRNQDIIAIEIKTDFKEGSALNDIQKLQVADLKIKQGYVIYFVKENEVETFNKFFAQNSVSLSSGRSLIPVSLVPIKWSSPF